MRRQILAPLTGTVQKASFKFGKCCIEVLTLLLSPHRVSKHAARLVRPERDEVARPQHRFRRSVHHPLHEVREAAHVAEAVWLGHLRREIGRDPSKE
eukprot:6206171-Pleurochrysis_carterae.AAC.2